MVERPRAGVGSDWDDGEALGFLPLLRKAEAAPMIGKGTKQGLCFIVWTVLIMFSCAVLAGYKEDLADKRGGSVPYITKHCVHEITGGHICCWCGVTISELNLHGAWAP